MTEQTPIDKLREELDREVALIQESPINLDHFPGHLPFGYARDAVTNLINLGRTHKVLDRDELSKTPIEFFAEIDRTIEELGLPLQEIRQLQQDTQVGGDDAFNRLAVLVTPVYRRLREMGYSQFKLTGRRF